jgi:16S rRNA (cytosine967-C5)-methyltransferase
VYVTCSIFPSENEWQIARFLKTNFSFSLSREKTLSTAKTGTDGFYMAELIRI